MKAATCESSIGHNSQRESERWENVIEQALIHTEAMLEDSNSLYYYHYHRIRYKGMAMHIASKYGRFDGLRVLDIGSHQLHFITVLHLLGANAQGIDMGVFTEAPENRCLSARLGISNQTINSLEMDLADFLLGKTYDIIVFSEILEHITFNPRRMWNAMLQSVPQGSILVTTPNVFSLHKLPGYFSRLFLLSGYGIKVEEIISTITYGHHWKEYSVHELKQYFKLLGRDFEAEVFTVEGTDIFKGAWLASALRSFLISVTNHIPLLRFQIFCWVRPGRTISR